MTPGRPASDSLGAKQVSMPAPPFPIIGTLVMMAGERPEGLAAMALRVHPFPADPAGVVSGWAQTNEEVLLWCGLPAAPVPAGQINAWADEDWVHPFGPYRDERRRVSDNLQKGSTGAGICEKVRS